MQREKRKTFNVKHILLLGRKYKIERCFCLAHVHIPRIVGGPRPQDQFSRFVAGHVELGQYAPGSGRYDLRCHHQFVDSKDEQQHWAEDVDQFL